MPALWHTACRRPGRRAAWRAIDGREAFCWLQRPESGGHSRWPREISRRESVRPAHTERAPGARFARQSASGGRARGDAASRQPRRPRSPGYAPFGSVRCFSGVVCGEGVAVSHVEAATGAAAPGRSGVRLFASRIGGRGASATRFALRLTSGGASQTPPGMVVARLKGAQGARPRRRVPPGGGVLRGGCVHDGWLSCGGCWCVA